MRYFLGERDGEARGLIRFKRGKRRVIKRRRDAQHPLFCQGIILPFLVGGGAADEEGAEAESHRKGDAGREYASKR